FKTVYLHGLVRDKDRQKMSKSKGNVIDPLGVAAEYGTDAVRAALVAGNTPGTDTAISEDKIRGYRNFATKLWNIARFISLHAQMNPDTKQINANDLRQSALHLRLSAVKKKVTKHLESYEFHLALETIYHYTWHEFADNIIEDAKKGKTSMKLLEIILEECLVMLHPFMPFVTEEIYQRLQELQGDPPAGGKKELLMVKKW
ncbi:MAG: class I tRNA ligase family protein, partial [Nanoarchaeota archaeon]|nr:class I tRNA ligase family protein [Nanoarchaeota archaeon]